ncbi:hypothetical protein RKE30_10545 [Streptomyces sp. Li-HN-5-11]|uniref:hypothetical protein n=1 Tax=Streptomyces sp. Li-HN-5-11 TaxID=3075432 RepID=UPI0028A6E007|nr:hypothetical protein [Streptomyces sp. Li-HN-5-11]WNM30818.1 hypothetical protein RKE30_10545 [Streptomyces sp. Li-HN-5-11]
MRTPRLAPVPARPLALLVAAAGVVTAVVVGRGGLETVVGCGLTQDRWPSNTAQDWVTYADHVVVASPVGEEETNRRDYTKGAIATSTDRKVTFSTSAVLWSSRRRPAQEVEKGFELTAPGWQTYRSGGTRTKKTAADQPRLEMGHTYLLALRYDDGHLAVLGEGAGVPFDHHTVGAGEWCGRVVDPATLAKGENFSRRDDNPLEETTLGQNEQAVRSELERAARH